MNFSALLHFAKERGILFATCHKKKAARFAVESADERKEFIGILVAKPVDEGESAIGAGGVNKPPSRFIDDQKRGMFQNDRRIHERTLVQKEVWVEV